MSTNSTYLPSIPNGKTNKDIVFTTIPVDGPITLIIYGQAGARPFIKVLAQDEILNDAEIYANYGDFYESFEIMRIIRTEVLFLASPRRT